MNKEDEDKEIERLNSKGHSIVKVECNKCKKPFETVVANVRKDFALKNDIFYCGEC
jgi:TRAP-type C4-dicarboxylate transport system substrate-binding protein